MVIGLFILQIDYTILCGLIFHAEPAKTFDYFFNLVLVRHYTDKTVSYACSEFNS